MSGGEESPTGPNAPEEIRRDPPSDARETAATRNETGGWLLLALLLVLGFWRWHDAILDPELHREEAIYLSAFRAVEDGDSPYDEGSRYKYTPAFAVSGAWLVRGIGERPALLALRFGNLVGVVLLAWVGHCSLPWSRLAKGAAAAALVVLSPITANGLFYGNVTFLLGGPALAALRFHRRRPWPAGIVLGLSLALKPMLVPAAALLASRGIGRAWPDVATRTAAIAAGTFGLLTLVARPELLSEMFAGVDGCPTCATNVSLERVAYCFDLHVHPLAWIALATAVALAMDLRREPDPKRLVAVGAALSVLGLPLVWPSTLALTFPLQLQALNAAWRRARTLAPWRAPSIALAPAAVLSLHGSGGVSALVGAPLPLQGLLTAIPLAALAGLTWLVSTDDPRDRRSA